MSAAEILEQIRQLPEKERREVAEQLWEEFGYFGNDPTAAALSLVVGFT